MDKEFQRHLQEVLRRGRALPEAFDSLNVLKHLLGLIHILTGTTAPDSAHHGSPSQKENLIYHCFSRKKDFQLRSEPLIELCVPREQTWAKRRCWPSSADNPPAE